MKFYLSNDFLLNIRIRLQISQTCRESTIATFIEQNQLFFCALLNIICRLLKRSIVVHTTLVPRRPVAPSYVAAQLKTTYSLSKSDTCIIYIIITGDQHARHSCHVIRNYGYSWPCRKANGSEQQFRCVKFQNCSPMQWQLSCLRTKFSTTWSRQQLDTKTVWLYSPSEPEMSDTPSMTSVWLAILLLAAVSQHAKCALEWNRTPTSAHTVYKIAPNWYFSCMIHARVLNHQPANRQLHLYPMGHMTHLFNRWTGSNVNCWDKAICIHESWSGPKW